VNNVLERDIESKVGDYAKKHGVWHRKFKTPQRRGAPDRVFAKFGRVFWIEFKAPGKLPSPLQKSEIAKMRAVGLTVHVVDNVENGKDIIDAFLKWEGL
jgi:hypothetical protein